MYCKVVFDVPLDRSFDYAVPAELRDRVTPGVRVTAPFGRMLTVGLVTELIDDTALPDNVLIKDLASVLDSRPVFGSDLFALANFMKERWGGPIGQILFSLVPPQPYFKLEDLPQPPVISLTPPAFTLSSAQNQALDILRGGIRQNYAPFLLSGPSCSGKTETALQLAGEILNEYGQILITVPDVLAAQNFIKEAEHRFGEGNVFSWHSRMLISKKKKVFSAVSGGRPCVVISTRSGGLLPFKNLRLAVMLQEESENYKQEENKPYFHLRDVLTFRAQQHGAVAVFVSSSPSLEIFKAVKEAKVFKLAFTTRLPGYDYKPQIKITSKKGEKSMQFSDFLLEEIKNNLEQKQACLLILDRRGYSNNYYCLNCGVYAKCKKCGTILVREKMGEEEFLLCRKCGHKEGMNQKCPQCDNLIFKSRGGGTQKVVTELSKLFPQARILRLDSDTLRTKDGQGHEVYDALKNKQVDIVVGTRPSAFTVNSGTITLSAVLDADLELNSPDFRASEKFGQMLFALRGRMGAVPNGRLIVQASSPDIYPFAPLFDGDYSAAAQEEMDLREGFNYPPFSALIKVVVKSKEEGLLNQEIAKLTNAFKKTAADILGPVRTGKKTDALKKAYLIFKFTPETYVARVCELDQWLPAKKVSIKLDADPYDFY